MTDTSIDEQILSALNQIFAYELQQAVIGDPLALNTLKQADLQDDPTITAPYLVYKPSDDNTMCLITGADEQEYGCAEIGGPIRYLHAYECKFGTPLALTRDQARADSANLMSRIMMCLIKYMDLSGVLGIGALESQDQSKRIEGNNNRLVRKAGYRIYGGEQTFYGVGNVYWQYPVSWYIQSRSFVG